MNDLSWRCEGRSIQGASHQRTGLVNQDAIRCETLTIDQQQALMMVVSDGHGGQSYFRSHIGSAIAVKIAAKIVKQSRLLQQIDLLPQQIVEQWRRSVMNHVSQHPFTAAEWERLEVQELWQGESRSQIEQDPTIAYGATLLMVVITKKFALYLQIGDGDILCVHSDGTIQHPLPPDPRLMANRTISLCTPQVWKEGRFKLIETALPAMILASTDGYANSYATDEDFQQIGADYLRKIRKEGFDHVLANLPLILQETSRRGSGDDVTLGVMYLENSALSETAIAPRSTAIKSPISVSAPKKRSWIWITPIPVLIAAMGYFVFLQQQSMTKTVPPAMAPAAIQTPVQMKPSPSPKPSLKAKPKKTQEKAIDDFAFRFSDTESIC
ncbi:PP2C family serine/threonine-protein phosphatase [Leptolyngbya sp. NIES-2104]|uniref:PP2C family serine/threonine-protein phosphatase n=1 Tax=Leptolyngbya sp. NIES-2104 TaxID=1552121 RepID=UPI0006EC5F2B|nr:PP2C family serine/threonine-protein phosphatase [Leptolyngbya sp. NIES-2104]GAP94459.1 hypothetical protein NIES2104_09700 [Leptolyngbya sp. NIES-2104]